MKKVIDGINVLFVVVCAPSIICGYVFAYCRAGFLMGRELARRTASYIESL